MSPLHVVLTLLAGSPSVAPEATPIFSIEDTEWVVPEWGEVVVQVAGLEDVTSSQPDRVEVKQLGFDRLSVRARSCAVSDLQLRTHTGVHRVRVFARWERSDLFPGIEHLPFTDSAIDVSPLSPSPPGLVVVFHGRLGSLDDAIRLEALAKPLPKSEVVVRYSPRRLAADIDELNAMLGPECWARWAVDRPQVHCLRGVPLDPEHQRRMESRFGPLQRFIDRDQVWIEPRSDELPLSAPTVKLGIGSQRVLSVPGLEAIGVGEPTAVEAKPISKGQVLLVGEHLGTSTVVVVTAQGKQSWRVEVSKQTEGMVICELCKWLGHEWWEMGGPGALHIVTVADSYLIEGTFSTHVEATMLSTLPRMVRNVRTTAKASETLREQARRQVEDALLRVGVVAKATWTGGVLQIDAPPLTDEQQQVLAAATHVYVDPLQPYL